MHIDYCDCALCKPHVELFESFWRWCRTLPTILRYSYFIKSTEDVDNFTAVHFNNFNCYSPESISKSFLSVHSDLSFSRWRAAPLQLFNHSQLFSINGKWKQQQENKDCTMFAMTPIPWTSSFLTFNRNKQFRWQYTRSIVHWELPATSGVSLFFFIDNACVGCLLVERDRERKGNK